MCNVLGGRQPTAVGRQATPVCCCCTGNHCYLLLVSQRPSTGDQQPLELVPQTTDAHPDWAGAVKQSAVEKCKRCTTQALVEPVPANA